MKGYPEAVAWIATNDEPGNTNADDIAETPTVRLVAHLTEKSVYEVATDILIARLESLVTAVKERARTNQLFAKTRIPAPRR